MNYLQKYGKDYGRLQESFFKASRPGVLFLFIVVQDEILFTKLNLTFFQSISNKRKEVIALIIITFILRLSLGLRDNVNIATRLYEDDSFYLQNTSFYLSQ